MFPRIPPIGQIAIPQIIKPRLQDCSLPHRFEVWNADDPKAPTLKEYLKHLAPSSRTGVILDDDLFHAFLCLREQEAMYKLFRRHRTMVMRSATTPSDPIPDVTVDAILPNRRLARQIAVDLSKGKGPLPYEGPVFEAEWRPNIPLKEILQTHLAE